MMINKYFLKILLLKFNKYYNYIILFIMNIITEDSPKIDFEFNFKKNIKLKPYQCSTIYKMLQFENFNKKNININKLQFTNLISEYKFRYYKHYNINDIYYSKHENDNRYNSFLDKSFFKNINNNINFNFYSNIGILSNKVGTGKTFIILGLIMYKKLTNESYNIYKDQNNILYNIFTNLPRDITNHISKFVTPNVGFQLMTSISQKNEFNNLYTIYKNNTQIINTNLIIVPHNLYNQWKTEITNYTYLNILFISDIRTIKKIKNVTDLEKYDIILCNVNKIKNLYNLTNKYKWSRIFIDEADTIKLPNFPHLQSNFLWFITNTYTRLCNVSNNGMIKDLFKSFSYHETVLIPLKNSLIIKCDQKYINKYLDLKSPHKIYKHLKTPFLNKILFEFSKIITINKYFYENIQTNNFENIKNILYDIIRYDTSILNSLIYYRRFLKNNFNYNIDIINNIFIILLIVINSKIILYSEKIKFYNKNYTRKIYKINIIIKLINFLETIKKTLEENNICKFCLTKKDNKIYCSKCNISDFYLDIFLNENPNFYIFQNIDFYKSNIINHINNIKPNTKILKYKTNIYKTNTDFIFNYNNKINYLLKNLKEDIKKENRILIFANDYNIFNKLESEFKNNKFNYKILKGNNNVLSNILKNYNNKKINILLLNSKYSGSGLNLQNSDKIYTLNKLDIETETQIIGRVNRIGQENDFEVIYLLYEDE